MGWLGALHGWGGRAQKKLHAKEYVVLSVGEVISLVAYQLIKYLMLSVLLGMNRACRRDERNLNRTKDEFEMTNLESYG